MCVFIYIYIAYPMKFNQFLKKVPTELELPNEIDQGETEVRNKEARPKVFPKSPNTLDAMEQATLHHAWSKFQILPAFAHNLLLIQSLMRGDFPFSCQFGMPSLCSEHVSRCKAFASMTDFQVEVQNSLQYL